MRISMLLNTRKLQQSTKTQKRGDFNGKGKNFKPMHVLMQLHPQNGRKTTQSLPADVNVRKIPEKSNILEIPDDFTDAAKIATPTSPTILKQ
jgi:hypothetical protein